MKILWLFWPSLNVFWEKNLLENKPVWAKIAKLKKKKLKFKKITLRCHISIIIEGIGSKGKHMQVSLQFIPDGSFQNKTKNKFFSFEFGAFPPAIWINCGVFFSEMQNNFLKFFFQLRGLLKFWCELFYNGWGFKHMYKFDVNKLSRLYGRLCFPNTKLYRKYCVKPVKKIFSQNIRFDFKPLYKYEQFC